MIRYQPDPTTEEQERNRRLSNGLYRNFCFRCDMPIEVAESRRFKRDMCCDACADHNPSAYLSTAFSSEKAKYDPA